MKYQKEKEMIHKELMTLAQICNSNLKNSNECLNYLKKRGITEKQINLNMIGFFPQNINILTKYVNIDILSKLNIVNLDSSSSFSSYNYLTIPILNEYGKFVGISGRSLLSDFDRSNLSIPKYRNSTYEKRNVLFGMNNALDEIVKSKKVFITEGYFDQISLYSNNIKNSVAVCGTAFSKGHYTKLLRFCDSMYFIMDNDSAGYEAAKRICRKFKNGPIKMFFLRSSLNIKDIDDFFKINTKKDFFKKYKIYDPCN